MSAVTLTPGEWVRTGLYEHRVRCSDNKWTEWVCDRPLSVPDVFRSPTGGHRTVWVLDNVAEAAGLDSAEMRKCPRCLAVPDLGPLPGTVTGEVRRSPDGLVAVAGSGTSADRRWRLVHPDPEPFGYGWRRDWDVAGWETVGNVLDLAGVGAARPTGGGQ